jgi:hypothetical protein
LLAVDFVEKSVKTFFMSYIFEAKMNLAYGDHKRADIVSLSCFEAVLAGEKTATTIFKEDGVFAYERWKDLKVGDGVKIHSRMFDPVNKVWPGDSLIIKVAKKPALINFNTMTDKQKQEWSKAEGYSLSWIEQRLKNNKANKAIQVHFYLGKLAGFRNSIG